MEKRCIGVDVGGTTVKIGVLSREGEVLEKWEIPTRVQEQGRHILPDIAVSVLGYLEKHGLSADSLVGVGIGVPGPVTADGYVEVCVNLGWRHVHVVRELTTLLKGIPVKAANDANVAALGEMWQGGGKGYKNIMLYTLGTGVGGGVVVEEKIVPGALGMGGEIGHIIVNTEERDSCNCGNHGCLEQYASATGIVKEMRRALEGGSEPSVLRGREGFSCKDVVDAAKEGDGLALDTLRRCMRYLALSMHYVTHVTNPEMFVVGGGVSKAGQFLLDMIREFYIGFTVMTAEKTPIGLATLGNDAGMYGAARLVLDLS